MSVQEKLVGWKGRLHVVAPSAPPKICGVGDHSFHLSLALASHGEVLVHCGQILPQPGFEGCEMVVDFDHRRPWTLRDVADSPSIRSGETVFVQYTNFAYGRYGFNPWIAPALARMRRRGVRVVTMFHETYMNGSEGWKAATMGWWQRHFFRQVGLNSDICLFSTKPWAEEYAPWFPGKKVECLPVGGNIRPVAIDRSAERERLGIKPDEPCLVIFGGTHPSRLFDWMQGASQALTSQGIGHKVLHVGPDAPEVARLLEGAPLIELGVQSEEGVSKALSVGDLMMAPISDGASTRRGSLLAGMQHGLCCITTRGPGTDALLESQSDVGLCFANDKTDFAKQVCRLAQDRAASGAIAEGAKVFYNANFAWSSVAGRLVDLLNDA